MSNRIRSLGTLLARRAMVAIEYVPLAIVALLATIHPAMAQQAPTTNIGAQLTAPLTSITHSMIVPVIGTVSGLGAGVGVIGHFKDPDHKEFFDKMFGYASVGTLGSIIAWNLPGVISSFTNFGQ